MAGTEEETAIRIAVVSNPLDDEGVLEAPEETLETLGGYVVAWEYDAAGIGDVPWV